MNELTYQSIPEFSKVEMELAIAENDTEKLPLILLFVSMYCKDRDFAHSVCVELAAHPNMNIRGCAIEGFGHLARIDGKLDEKTFKPLLEKGLIDTNEFVRIKANDAKDDVTHFLKWNF